MNLLIELDPPIVTKSAVTIASGVYLALCPFEAAPTPMHGISESKLS